MSDPVTNVEDVEDVLSSIRRLVSDTSKDKRKQPDNVDAGASDDVARPEALVLTSALRIDEPAAEEDVADKLTTPSELESLRRAVSGEYDDDEDEDLSNNEQDNDMTERWSSAPPEDYYEDEPVEPLDAPVASNEAETEWLEDEAEAEPETTLETEALAEEEPVWDAQEEESVLDTSEGETDDTEDHIADDHDADSHQIEEHEEPHTAEIHSFDAGEPEDALDEEPLQIEADEWEDAAEPDIEERNVEEADDVEVLLQDSDEIPDNLVEIAVIEDAPQHDDAVVVEQHSDGHDEIETVGIASFLRSGGHSTEEKTVNEGDENLNSDTVFDDEGDAERIDLGDLDEAVIDEEMLRDLVAEIVREELTGAMGERITRNVRKLVRREIHRAMISREFD